MMRNPKQDGSPLLDAVPQSGKCPLNCRACYFNLGFYRDVPFVPTAEEAEGHIVRVCSGNDANNQRDLVIEATAHLKDKYYCTAVPRFDFPGPVVFTCNPDEEAPPTLKCGPMHLMAVRFRYAPWLDGYLQEAVDHYCRGLRVPLLITPMRYAEEEDIPEEFRDQYIYREHILHPYWMLKDEENGAVALRRRDWGHPLAFVCAGLCKDCLLCVHFYHQAARRMQKAEHKKAKYVAGPAHNTYPYG